MPKLDITKKLKQAGSLLIVIAVMFLTSAQAHAEYLGFPSGRSAKISSAPTTSVEAGFVTGDLEFDEVEWSYQGIGARINFRASADLVVFVDLVQAELEDADGLGYGAGLLYQIPGITKSNDFAIKLSYHTTKQEEADFIDFNFNALAIEALLSGQEIGESNLRWYANVGIHKFDIDEYDQDGTEFGFGAGVVSDTSFGEFYAGVDLIGEMIFGFGIRYHLQ